MPDTVERIIQKYESVGFDNVIKEQERLAKQYEETDKAANKTSSGIDKIANRAKNLGQGTENLTTKLGKLSSLGRDLRQAGGFLGNDTIASIGEVADGFGDIAQSIEGVTKKGALGKILGGGIGAIGAVAGGVVAGSAIYDATIGKQQGTDAGTIVKQVAADIGARFQEQFKELRTGVKDVDAYTKAINENAHAAGLISDAQYKATAATYDAAVRAQTENEAFAASISHVAISAQQAEQGLNVLGNIIAGLGAGDLGQKVKELGGVANPNRAKLVDEFAKYQDSLSNAEKKFNDSRLSQQADYEQSYQDIVERFAQQNRSAYQGLIKGRMKIVEQGVEEEQKAEQTYYKERLVKARDFGLAMARAEEDHQVEMRRMAQDHGRRLQKLIEQRDALGVEDEQANYRIERNRAEEDYNLTAKRQNEDYARQMADMETAFNEQRTARAADRQKQLQELQQNYNEASAQRASDQKKALQELSDQNTKRQTTIKQGYDSEVRQINDSFTEKRQALGIWYTGEEAQHLAHLQILGQQFDEWFKARAATMGASTQDYGGGVSSHAMGGYTSGLTMTGEQGYEYVLSHQTTRAAESMLGGRITQNKLIGAMIGSMTQNFSGQSASPEQYRQIVYQTLIDVMNKAAQ